jgi:hypothetical protein
MLGSRNQLTSSGDARLDKMQRATSPGMVDWCDLDGSNHCASCRHFQHRHCMLFVREMRARLKNPRFFGPKLPPGQRACRRYEKASHGAGAFSDRHAPQGEKQMASMTERHPRKGFITVADVEHRDLVVQISGVEFDVMINGETKDVLHFTNGRSLPLNDTNIYAIVALHGDDHEGWPDKRLALFNDTSVKFGDKITGGVRVRPFVPEGDGLAKQSGDGGRSGRPNFSDEIPF